MTNKKERVLKASKGELHLYNPVYKNGGYVSDGHVLIQTLSRESCDIISSILDENGAGEDESP